MYAIVSKQPFSEKVFKIEVEAPLIARSRKAGPEGMTRAALVNSSRDFG